jgi:hypothetical protein
LRSPFSLISAPFVEEFEGSNLILPILFSLVLLAAVFAVADRKRVLLISLVLAGVDFWTMPTYQ